ncbi:unnamed protein product [Effrenium voratum]|nr:unnamed protein product [Effrenium voratum]
MNRQASLFRAVVPALILLSNSLWFACVPTILPSIFQASWAVAAGFARSFAALHASCAQAGNLDLLLPWDAKRSKNSMLLPARSSSAMADIGLATGHPFRVGSWT